MILFILFYPLRVLAINNTNKESLDMSTRSIAKIVTANEQAEGAGARVRRSIGIMNQRNFDPFLMFDHFPVLVLMGSQNIHIEVKKLSH